MQFMLVSSSLSEFKSIFRRLKRPEVSEEVGFGESTNLTVRQSLRGLFDFQRKQYFLVCPFFLQKEHTKIGLLECDLFLSLYLLLDRFLSLLRVALPSLCQEADRSGLLLETNRSSLRPNLATTPDLFSLSFFTIRVLLAANSWLKIIRSAFAAVNSSSSNSRF